MSEMKQTIADSRDVGTKRQAEVRMHLGTPTLFVDDRPRFLNAPYLAKAPYEDFATAGTGIYLLHDHQFDVSPDGNADATAVSHLIESLLEKEPSSLIITRSFPPVPGWWLDAHPDEALKFDTPTITGQGYREFRDVSWGSDLWLAQACKWYQQWCSELEKRFAGNVIGHQFGMGAHGENGQIGAPVGDGRWLCGDFSPAMLKWFRSWLATQYDSDKALQRAWSDDSVTLATATVPGRLQRLQKDWLTFRSPLRRHVADYYQSFATRVEHVVITLCRTIKNATGGRCITGSHLGTFMDNGYHGMLYHSLSTCIMHQALKDPAVDLFTSPSSYENRGPGGDANSMMPAGSIALHGKLIFQDQDTLTSTLPAGYYENHTLSNIGKDLDESTELLKRDFGHMLVRGYGLWWHPLVKGMYSDAAIQKCIAKLSQIGTDSLDLPAGQHPGVAMIVDEHSGFHQACVNRLFYPMLYYQRQYCWGQSGVPWNVYLHDDLSHPQFQKHQAYYFLNTFYLTDDEVAAIQNHLQGSGATAIWTYAPGIQSPSGMSLKRTEHLTGFRLKSADVEALPVITLTDFSHPYVQFTTEGLDNLYALGGKQQVGFGTGPKLDDERQYALGPLIYVDDPQAHVLGELGVLREPGFAVKQMDGWTSVFVAAPMLDTFLLRNIARASGVHVYSETNDIILPGKSHIMLHATRTGQKQINLPYTAKVTECYEGRSLGKHISSIVEHVQKHQTRLYRIEPA